jgi:competence protein ComEA
MNRPSDPPPPNDFLRPREQRTVAVLAAGALALLAAVWWRHGGHRDVIDIDRAPPLVAKFQVDVNRADWPELIQLPGIGPTLAQRLVDDRQQHGPFHDVEDLARVTGLGPRTLERIRPYLLPIPKDSEFVDR